MSGYGCWFWILLSKYNCSALVVQPHKVATESSVGKGPRDMTA